MFIFLYGPDTYRSRRKLNEIIAHYKEVRKSGLNLKYFEKLNYADFKDQFQQISMLREKKLLILTKAFSNQEFKSAFLKDFKKLKNQKTDDTILFYEEGVILKSDPLFVFLKKNAGIQEFKLLEAQKLKDWAGKEIESRHGKISPQALAELTGRAGNDLWRLSNEIQKLLSFKKNTKIEIKDVEILVRPGIETDIFRTIDSLAAKNKKQALALIHRHLEKGDSPLYILSMINFQFRNILEIKDLIEKRYSYYDILKQSKLHPYVVKKSYQQACGFNAEELKKIYRNIFQADIDIKTGKIDPQFALDLLVAEI